MGAAGLGFHMTQFCLRGARPLSEGRRITGDVVDMWHWGLCEEKGNSEGWKTNKETEKTPKAMLPRVSQGSEKFVCTLEHAGVSFKGIKYYGYF